MKDFLRQAEKSFAFNQGASEIKRFTQPFLDKFGLQNYYYVRIKRNGECIFLTNHLDFAMGYWEAELPFETGFDKPSNNQQRQGLSWRHLIDEPTRRFCEYHDCYDGFSLIDRYYDTLQISTFLRSRPTADADGFYLNNLEEMRTWVRHFEEQNDVLIKHCLGDPIVLPQSYLLAQKNAFYPTRTLNISYNGLTAKITFRELDCICLLSRGFTIPKIASLLTLSPRTVQTHLESVKNYFGLHTRDDLAKFAYSNHVVQSYIPRTV